MGDDKISIDERAIKEDWENRLKKATCQECCKVGTLIFIRDEKTKNLRVIPGSQPKPLIKCECCGWEWWANFYKRED